MLRRVLGLGEPMAGDDGAGPAAIRRLRCAGVPSDIELLEARDATAVLAALDGNARVVVLDAVVGAGSAGTVVSLDAASLVSGGVRPVSTHGVTLTEALALAETLSPGACERVKIVGIAIESAERGSGRLSAAVENALEPAAREALALLGESLPARHGTTGDPGPAHAATPDGAVQPAARGDDARRRLRVRGIVQGVGFRPFVYRTARAMGLGGWVRNLNGAVEIEVQGSRGRLDAFARAVRADGPPGAAVSDFDEAEIEAQAFEAFRIVPSDAAAPPSPALPADLATCDACLAELRDPQDRRFRYPFTNCTRCGPRFSIVERTPYDRARTSMKVFPLCPDCRAEYEDPSDRRFHAEPIACPRCGPRVTLLDAAGVRQEEGDAAIEAAARALRGGAVVALKGLGGFQLLADATSGPAVARLRARKRREGKPFAVMMQTLDEIRRHCRVPPDAAEALSSPAAPIFLLDRCAPPPEGPVAAEVAPGNPRLGVMLPYTPLHHLLLQAAARPLVCTSGNLSEEPMCTETAEALARLAGVADLFLTHDRPIVRPLDDSVARLDGEDLQVLRRARGYAPQPLPLPQSGPVVLALGGHLKAAAALALGSEAIGSAHVGDLVTPEARSVLERSVEDLLDFFEARPEVLACDLHPDYASTILAERLAARWNVPLVRVQHHHAHAASALLEHGLEGPLLAFAWDGSGAGGDGTLWGGEALLASAGGFRRVATLRPFRLPGGERAIREPRRSAIGLLHEIDREAAHRHAGRWFRDAEVDPLLHALSRGLNAPWTTGMGRLFDAAAALAGGRARSGFEGQAAMEFEFALADRTSASEQAEEEPYPLPLVGDEPMRADWEPLVRALLEDAGRGESRAVISARFHGALAELAAAVVRRTGARRALLTGGCFQNAALTDRVRRRLQEEGCTALAHRAVPPNDGGIAFGQLLVARATYQEETRVPRRSR